MPRIVPFLFCFGALLVGCTSQLPTVDPYEMARNAGVEILVDGRLDGSGWFGDPGTVVTAAHVVGFRPGNIEVVTAAGKRLPAKVIALDWRHDIALLKVAGGPYPSLEVAAKQPAIGEPVFFYGAALYRHRIMLRGAVAREGTTYAYFGDRAMPMRAYHISAPSPPGTSGGPWIDDHGRIIGNQSGFVTNKGAGAGIAIVTPPDAIRALLANRTSVISPDLGCGVEELWTQSRGFIRRFPKGTQGVVTFPIRKGGPAEAAGLTKETVIIGVAGKPVRYRDDLLKAVYALTCGNTIDLRVLFPDDPKPREVKVTLGSLGPQLKEGS